MLKSESSCRDSDYIGVQRSDGSKDPSLRFSTLLIIVPSQPPGAHKGLPYKSLPRLDRDSSSAILEAMFRTKRPAWRITLSALPILPLLLTLTIAPALAQEEANGDYYTIKYDQDGNQLWHASYDGGEWDYAYGVAVDSDNNVIVTGASEIWHDYDEDGEEDEGEINCDYYTIKYDSNGKKLWEVTYDNGGRDEAYGIAVDSENNIIVTGRSFNGLNYDYLTIKYNSDGKELWDEPVIYDGEDVDGANSLAVDSADNVIVTGYSKIWHDYDQNGQRDDGEVNLDYYTIKYDKDGEELWSKAYDQGRDDGALEVVVDSTNNVIVTGASERWHDYNENGKEDEGEVKSDYCTIKYDQDGNEVWDEPLFYDSGHSDTAYGAAVDSEDNIIVTGSYSTPPEVEPGTWAPPLMHCYTTMKYNSEGIKIWEVTYDGDGQENVYDVAVDSEDNVIVTGKAFGVKDFYTIKYDKHGKELWSEVYDSGQWDSALDVAVDSADNIIVTGSSQGPPEANETGGGFPAIAIAGIAVAASAGVGGGIYLIRGWLKKPLPRGERRRRAAKQRKKAA